MTLRSAFWYVFGLAAVALLLYRLRPTQRANLRDPLNLSFTLMVFVAAMGTLAKQPPIAGVLDGLLGPNAAWLIADILFIAGICAGTVWIDLLSQPALAGRGWRLFLQWRVAALLGVAGWMVAAAWLTAPTWAALERGTVELGGNFILVSARTAFFVFSVWVLGYLSWGLYRHRQMAHSREIYLRLTIPFAGLALAPAASVIQLVAVWADWVAPALVAAVWPILWSVVTAIQIVVMLLILAAFFSVGYRSLIWLDKRLLLPRLRAVYAKISQARPDLVRPINNLAAENIDAKLAALVDEIELAKRIAGPVSGTPVEAPAGAVMTEAARSAFQRDRASFQDFLAGNEPTQQFALVRGDAYALARWYVAVGSRL